MRTAHLIIFLILLTALVFSCVKDMESNQIRIANRTGIAIDRISVSSVLNPNVDRETLTFENIPVDQTTNFLEIGHFNKYCPLIEVLSPQVTLPPVLDDCIDMDPTSPSIHTIFLFLNEEGEIYYQIQDE